MKVTKADPLDQKIQEMIGKLTTSVNSAIESITNIDSLRDYTRINPYDGRDYTKGNWRKAGVQQKSNTEKIS